jgi:hypothetical protein
MKRRAVYKAKEVKLYIKRQRSIQIQIKEKVINLSNILYISNL